MSDYTGISDSQESGLFPALLLVVLTVLFFVNLIPVQRAHREAENAGIRISSDDDLLRSRAILTGDSVIYDYIRANIPVQTPVSIPYDKRNVERVQRFWLALLPDYPIHTDASLRIVANDRIPQDGTVLARGSLLSLVEIKGGDSVP